MAPILSFLLSCLLSCLYLTSTLAQDPLPRLTTTVNPAVLPLIVKTPYLNMWIRTRAENGSVLSAPGGEWPMTAWGKEIRWLGLIRVDNTSYVWQGALPGVANARTVATYFSPSTTIFTLEAGPMVLNVTYVAMIRPSDTTDHTFPFGFVAVDFRASDNERHAVQFYSDITGDWLTDNHSDTVLWNTTLGTSSTKTMFHAMWKQNQEPLTETNEFPNDGTLYFVTPTPQRSPTWATGSATGIRDTFRRSGILGNVAEGSGPRAVFDGTDYTVLAFANDLGETFSPTKMIYSVGIVRDPIVSLVQPDSTAGSLTPKGGPQLRSGLFMGDIYTIPTAIDQMAGVDGYEVAKVWGVTLDQRIMKDAQAYPPQYANLVAYATRQVFAAVEVTGVGRGGSSPKAYMKDVGSSGRITPVELLYASLPAFFHVNATLARLLYEPLLDYQAIPSLYKNEYAAPDLGTTYPAINGNPTDTSVQAIDNTGSMLVMAVAIGKKTGFAPYIETRYDLFKKWADYLIKNYKYTSSYQSSDGSTTANPNLALKTIAGIYAMGEMDKVYAEHKKQKVNTHYTDTANKLKAEWMANVMGGDHIPAKFDDPNSWNLLYNAFYANIVNKTFVEESPLQKQSDFYKTQFGSVPPFGFPNDVAASAEQVRSDWLMLTAAAMPDTAVRDRIISMVHDRAFWNTSRDAFPHVYDANSGATIRGRASPAQGAMFALIVPKEERRMSIENWQWGPPPSTTPGGSSGNSSNRTGHYTAFALRVGLSTAFSMLFLLLVIWFVIYKRKKDRQKRARDTNAALKKLQMDMAAAAAAKTAAVHDDNTSSGNGRHGGGNVQLHDPSTVATPFIDDETRQKIQNQQITPFPPSPALATSGQPTGQMYNANPGFATAALPVPATRSPAPTAVSSNNSFAPTTSPAIATPATTMPSPPQSVHDNAMQAEIEQLRREVASLRGDAATEPAFSVHSHGPPQYDDLTQLSSPLSRADRPLPPPPPPPK